MERVVSSLPLSPPPPFFLLLSFALFLSSTSLIISDDVPQFDASLVTLEAVERYMARPNSNFKWAQTMPYKDVHSRDIITDIVINKVCCLLI